LRKDQVDTIEDNKNIKMLKDKLWLRQVNMKTEVVVIRGSQVVEETILLEEIRKKLEKDDGIVYMVILPWGCNFQTCGLAYDIRRYCQNLLGQDMENIQSIMKGS